MYIEKIFSLTHIYSCAESPSHQITFSIVINTSLSVSFVYYFVSAGSALASQLFRLWGRQRKEKEERQRETEIEFFLSVTCELCVCDLDTIMSAYRDEDPRIQGIKTKIRVVPNFPKPGSFSFLCFLAEKMWEMKVCWRIFFSFFIFYNPTKREKKTQLSYRLYNFLAWLKWVSSFFFLLIFEEPMAHESARFKVYFFLFFFFGLSHNFTFLSISFL